MSQWPPLRGLACVAIVAAAGGIAHADDDQQYVDISGRIIDALGKPVSGAEVSVEGSDAKPVKTDKQGRYRIDHVLPGKSITIAKDGYQTGLGNVPQTTEVDDIVLLTLDQNTEVIEVQGSGPPPAPGAAKLDRGELERIPGTGNDLVRTLSAMPGVANFPLPLGYSGVVIRGSSPQDSKVLIDDFEVPVLFHDIGFRAVVPTEAIDKLDYIPGGFDVQYGRASSGIVSLTTRPGDVNRSEQIEASVIDTGAIAQGSTQKARYMIAFRRSLIDLILPAILPADLDLSLTTVPRYYDGQARVDYKMNDRWDLRISAIGSDDILELFADAAENADKRFFNRTRFLRVTTAAHYHAGPWSANLALSGIDQQFIFDRGIHQFIEVTAPTVTARGEVSHQASQWAGLKDFVWRVGGEANISHNEINLALPQEKREGQPMNTDDPNDTSETFKGTVTSPDFAAWTAASASLDERVKFSAGARLDVYSRNKTAALQPRGEVDVIVAPKLTARLSAGMYSRPPEFQSELLVDNVKPERSTQTIVGLNYEPNENLRVQTSLYYTDRYDLLTYGTDGMTLINQGRGTTTGAEVFAQYHEGPWFGFLSYSYSHSTRVDMPGADRRLFDYDQPHSLNVALSHRWKKWQLGGRFQLYSGLPQTPVVGSVFDSDSNQYIPINGKINSDRAPIHHQLDLRLDRYWRWGPVDLSWFLDVQNVYLNQSVVAYFYSYDYTQRSEFKGLPIIPSAGVRGTF